MNGFKLPKRRHRRHGVAAEKCNRNGIKRLCIWLIQSSESLDRHRSSRCSQEPLRSAWFIITTSETPWPPPSAVTDSPARMAVFCKPGTAGNSALLVLSSDGGACDSVPAIPGAARVHLSVEPGGQPVGVADGVGLVGEHEEDGLERVPGMVPVSQELSADVEDHRPVPCH
jgi:hypothetical protein